MAVMSDTTVPVEAPAVEAKLAPVDTGDVMELDSKVNGNGTNGHVGVVTTTLDVQLPEVSKPVDSLSNGATNGTNGDGVAPSNGDAPAGIVQEKPTEPVAPQPADDFKPQLSIESSSENPISEDTSSAPQPVAQTTSDVRDEPTNPPDTTPAAPIVANEKLSEPAPPSPLPSTTAPAPEATEPKVEDAKLTEPQQSSSEVVAPTTEIQPTPSLSETQTSTTAEPSTTQPKETMSIAAGQVRPREEEETVEPSAKRTKVESEDIEMGNAPADGSAAMPPPATSSGTPVPTPVSNAAYENLEWDKSALTKPQLRYLLEQLRKAKKTKAALPFLAPVDPVALNIPNYPIIVTHPMDLSTMGDRLKNEKYESANHLWQDFETMVGNCVKFNGRDHPVTHNAYNLKAYFAKLMYSLPRSDAVVEPKKKSTPTSKPNLPRRESRTVTTQSPAAAAPPPPPKPQTPKVKETPQKHEAFLDANGVPIIRRESTSDRPKREIIKPPSRDLPYNTNKPKKKKFQIELKFCETVLKEMSKAKYGTFVWPFQNPVDPVALNIPTYHRVIKKPMDFGTIRRNLDAGEYANAKEFYVDAKLVFSNCYKFNPPTDEVYNMGKQSEAVFDEVWAKKDEFIAANQPPSEPVTDEESEEESDDNEPEDDFQERHRKIAEIQTQISALTQQLVELTNYQPRKKVKSKETKVKSEKSKKKRTSTSAASGSKSKSKKDKKPVKKLSLDQKRYVSEGIMMLDESNMRKAVQIIRNGVPKLKDVNDDELELDVDEIPDNVLWDLLRFVQQHRKSIGADAGDDEDYTEPEVAAKANTTQRKKSKPMSAREQESKIAQVRQQLERFKDQSGSDQANDAGAADTSEEDSSSSEEE